MTPHHGILAVRSIRWLARLWSLASFAVLVALAVGGAGGGPAPSEMVGMMLFPIGVMAGFIVAWWREGIGGGVTVLSLMGFYLWHLAVAGRLPGGPYFLLLAAPGALFMATALMSRKWETAPMGDR